MCAVKMLIGRGMCWVSYSRNCYWGYAYRPRLSNALSLALAGAKCFAGVTGDSSCLIC